MGNLKNRGFERHPLKDSDKEALFKAIETDKERLCFHVLVGTGLRVSEFCSLTKEDIFFDRGLIVVRGKGGKQRSVPMSKTVRDLLYHHFSLNDDIGMTRQTVGNVLKRLKKKADVEAKVTPHVLRHTFAVDSLRAGVDLKALQRAMGHSSISITEIYLKYTEDYVVESFRKAGY